MMKDSMASMSTSREAGLAGSDCWLLLGAGAAICCAAATNETMYSTTTRSTSTADDALQDSNRTTTNQNGGRGAVARAHAAPMTDSMTGQIDWMKGQE